MAFIQSIARYEDTTVLKQFTAIDYGNEEKKYFSSEIDAIAHAVKNGYPIAVRGGVSIDAQWYFKGKGMNIDELKLKVEDAKGKHPRRLLFLIHMSS